MRALRPLAPALLLLAGCSQGGTAPEPTPSPTPVHDLAYYCEDVAFISAALRKYDASPKLIDDLIAFDQVAGSSTRSITASDVTSPVTQVAALATQMSEAFHEHDLDGGRYPFTEGRQRPLNPLLLAAIRDSRAACATLPSPPAEPDLG